MTPAPERATGSVLRLGIAGCGRVVERFHLPALARQGRWQLVAAADRSPARRDWIAGAAPGLTLYETTTSLLQEAALDGLLVAVPPEDQLRVAHQAVRAGVPVLLEKPAGTDGIEVESLRTEAARNGVPVQVGFNRRFMRNYLALRRRIAARPPAGRWTGEFTLQADPSQWSSVTGVVGDASRHGGVLFDLVPHQLDLLRFLLPVDIAALKMVAGAGDRAGQSAVDFAVEFADGGEVRCRANHGEGYQERFSLQAGSESLLLYPTGLIRGPLTAGGLGPKLVVASTWLDRKLIRLGLKADFMLESFIRQLAAFAERESGEGRALAGAELSDALAVHRMLSKLRIRP